MRCALGEALDSRFRLVRTDKFAVVAQGALNVISSFQCTDARGQRARFELLNVEGYSWGAEVRGLALSDQAHWGTEIESIIRDAFWHHSMLVFGASSLYACDCPSLSAVCPPPPSNNVDALCELLEKTLHTTAAYEAFARLCSGDEWKIEDVASYGTLYSLARHQRLEQLLTSIGEHIRRAASGASGSEGNSDSNSDTSVIPCETRLVDTTWSLLQRTVRVVLDSGATSMKHGNTRCQILKHIGYVLPTDALISWVAQCFTRSQCTRIISIGSGCAFLELALCLWFVRHRQEKHRRPVTRLSVICVDDDSEQLGAGVAGATRTPFSLGGQAARVADSWGIEMVHTEALPQLTYGDGLLISWGRPKKWTPEDDSSRTLCHDGGACGGISDSRYPQHTCDNVWERVARAAAQTEGVDVAVVIGEAGEDAQTWPCDRWQGCRWQHGSATGTGCSAETWKATESSEHGVNVARFNHFATDFAVEWSRCLPNLPNLPSCICAHESPASGVRFIIAPGNGGCGAHTKETNWYGWLDGELKVRGHESLCVNWPDPYTCHQSNWIPFARDELKADENTVVVGHSTGALLAMRLLETHKIKGAILVSAAHTDMGDPSERASGYFDEPWNFAAMTPNATFIHQFHSADDNLIPVAEARFVADNLAGDNFTYQELNGFSHFFSPFQPLLDAIDKYCPPAPTYLPQQ